MYYKSIVLDVGDVAFISPLYLDTAMLVISNSMRDETMCRFLSIGKGAGEVALHYDGGAGCCTSCMVFRCWIVVLVESTRAWVGWEVHV